jgi:hypothetical protein
MKNAKDFVLVAWFMCNIWICIYDICYLYFYYKLVKDDLIENRYSVNELFNQFMHAVLDLILFIK